MSSQRVRDKQVCVHMTERERKALRQKSAKAGVTVSEYVRQTLIHSDDASITLIDTPPFNDALFELRRQGANLNQYLKLLNTYGPDMRDEGMEERILEGMSEAYMNVTGALIALREEAEKHGLVIDFEKSVADLDEE